jgi:hypothetical protein
MTSTFTEETVRRQRFSPLRRKRNTPDNMISRLARVLGSSPRFRPTMSCILLVVSLGTTSIIALPAPSSEGGSLHVDLRLSGPSARRCCCCSREALTDSSKSCRGEPSFKHLFSRIRLRGGSFYAPPPPYRRTNPTREQTTLWADCKCCSSSFHHSTVGMFGMHLFYLSPANALEHSIKNHTMVFINSLHS